MTSEKTYDTTQRLDDHITSHPVFSDANQGLANWEFFGNFSNGWSKASGVAHFRVTQFLSGPQLLICQLQNIAPGTTTNGTTVITSGNGFPSGRRPGETLWFPMRSDNLGGQSPAFMVHTDGHVECYGVAAGATRFDGVIIYAVEN